MQGQSAAAPHIFHSKTQQTCQNSTWSMFMNTSLTQSCSWVGQCGTFCCQLPPKGLSLQSWASASASQHPHQLCWALGAASLWAMIQRTRQVGRDGWRAQGMARASCSACTHLVEIRKCWCLGATEFRDSCLLSAHVTQTHETRN